jgi:phage tail-like protein
MIERPPRVARVPVIPEPPHDPTSLLIDSRTAWLAAEPDGFDGVVASPCDGSLTLAFSAEASRSFTESSGSFGGLSFPSNVALLPDGSLLLLDRSTLTLKRFDPCCCRFVDWPCTGGRRSFKGGGAREFRNPGGIAVCDTRLYVSDTGRDGLLSTGTNPRRNALRARIRRENHRVSVFLLPGLELHGHLKPPKKVYPHWRPVDVACDARCCVWVLDEANGVVHRFTPRGRWTDVVKGLNEPSHMAIDRCGRLWVIDHAADDTLRIRLFDDDGQELPAPKTVEEASSFFEPLPFEVSATGLLSLAELCTAKCPPCELTFNLNGDPADPPPLILAPFLTAGTYQTSALDSRRQLCQWHRVILHGDLPPSTRVRVETFCADEEYDGDQIAGFAVWERQEVTGGIDASSRRIESDCLVPSPPGRYLWLKLTLLGNGTATPVISAIEIEFPRLSSLRYLPAVFAAEPVSADFTARFLSLFDTPLRRLERAVDTEASLFDPASTPAKRVGTAPIDFLSWLASWIGIAFDRSWSEARRRRFLKQAGRLFAWRGTPEGLRQQLLQFLGWSPVPGCGLDALPRCSCSDRPLNCAPPPEAPSYGTPPLILEHFRLRRWLWLGVARIGAQAVLWGQRLVNRTQLDSNAQADFTRLITTPDPRRDPLHFYAHRFSVFVPACAGRTDAEHKSLENLLRTESPAHTHWEVVWVEPRFRIGVQSMIGFDAVVAGLPPAWRLGGLALGTASLVGGTVGRHGRRELRVGRSGRVGTGAQLN